MDSDRAHDASSAPTWQTPTHQSASHCFRKGLWEGSKYLLVMISRGQNGREATPSIGIIDSQSVKTAESGGPCGYDTGKKIKGHNRYILTDTQGHIITAVVHPANFQGRDEAPLVIEKIYEK